MGLINKLFGPARLEQPLDFSAFGVDMHSHLIPGIDDGVKSVEESLEMIRGLKDMGFTKLISTPHSMADVYINSTQIIRSGLQKVKNAVAAAGLEVEIEAAAEYLMDDRFPEKLENRDLLTMGKNHILVEMSYIKEPVNLNHLLFDIQTAGYKIILAHAERYSFWFERRERYQQMIDRSVHLQLNLLSLSGYYGKDVKRTALWLLENDMYSVVGTDLHNEIYLKELQNLQYDPVLLKLLEKSDNYINKDL